MGSYGTFRLPDREIEVEAPKGCRVTEAAERAGIMLNTSCAEQGTCGGCAVDLVEGVFETAGERIVASGNQTRRVLGCQTQILSRYWRIAVPRRSLVEAGEKVVVDYDLEHALCVRPSVRKVYIELPTPTMDDSAGDFERISRHLRNGSAASIDVKPTLEVLRELPGLLTSAGYKVTVTLALRHGVWELIDVEAGDTSSRSYGVAVDVGTTTVVCSLVDLTTGRLINSASCYNQQVQRADDVASRIVCAQGPDGLTELHRLIVDETINRLIRLLCKAEGIVPEDISRLVVSGNTIMSHLFLCVDPRNMGGIPFQPAASGPGTFRAGKLGVGINPAGFVDVVPSISAYVGGDITSDLHVSGLTRSDESSLIVDLGTNGEIAICHKGRLMATATAAGPAFEGGRIRCGMRASTGAIEHIRIDPETLAADVDVIGGNAPIGICGSGLIDLIAEARRVGLIDETGRLGRALMGRSDRLVEVKTEQGACLGYVVVPRAETEDRREDILVDERDIATLLQAKAAMYAGITILLQQAGVTLAQIDRFYLAGGFARHIDLRSAIAMGLLPDLPLAKYSVLGNGSLAGAVVGLVDHEAWQAFQAIAAAPRIVELNTIPEFQDEYVNAMFIPHLMPERFPSVTAGR
ncbi:MAG: DUF4445 domain-containing protein [Phycisphaerae bacterium]|nr:DUF4445 domain-containing protein [Phycisphaerae bacterium]